MFGNVEFVQDDEAEDGKATPVPVPMAQIIADLMAAEGNRLLKTGGKLFAHIEAASQVDWLLDPSALFGWIQTQLGIVNWRGGTGYVTKAEFAAELLRTAPEIAAVEALPHWPPMPGHLYTCPKLSPGDG